MANLAWSGAASLPRWHTRVLGVAAWMAAAVVAAVFCWLLLDILMRGLGGVSLEFLLESPRNAGREGGIVPLLVSTLLLLGVAIITAVPLALGAAIWLNEFVRQRQILASRVRFCLDMLAGMPSIVIGLFGNAFFSIYLGLGFSILSGGLTLACMVLPIMIRTTESGLAAVPDSWRLGAAALGLTRAAALRHVLLPAAAPALVTGLILGVGRAMAETAALVFTSGYVDRMPGSLLDSGRSLAVHIYDLSMNVTGGDHAAYATALVLVCMLILINAAAFRLSDALANNRSSV